MEFLDVPIFDDDVFKLLVRFGINLVFLTLVVALAIYPNQRQREFAFTAVMLNIVVFFICFTMKKLELDLGLALGLFAVFGVLRYRTDAIRPKEMTYLFIVIGVAVINSLANKKTSYAEVALVNSIILIAALLKERVVGNSPTLSKQTSASPTPQQDKANGRERNGDSAANGREASGKKLPKLTVEYDRLELLGAANHETLLEDLRQRTGMDVVRAELKAVNLRDKIATLSVWTTPRDGHRDETPPSSQPE